MVFKLDWLELMLKNFIYFFLKVFTSDWVVLKSGRRKKEKRLRRTDRVKVRRKMPVYFYLLETSSSLIALTHHS